MAASTNDTSEATTSGGKDTTTQGQTTMKPLPTTSSAGMTSFSGIYANHWF